MSKVLVTGFLGCIGGQIVLASNDSGYSPRPELSLAQVHLRMGVNY